MAETTHIAHHSTPKLVDQLINSITDNELKGKLFALRMNGTKSDDIAAAVKKIKEHEAILENLKERTKTVKEQINVLFDEVKSTQARLASGGDLFDLAARQTAFLDEKILLSTKKPDVYALLFAAELETTATLEQVSDAILFAESHSGLDQVDGARFDSLKTLKNKMQEEARENIRRSTSRDVKVVSVGNVMERACEEFNADPKNAGVATMEVRKAQ